MGAGFRVQASGVRSGRFVVIVRLSRWNVALGKIPMYPIFYLLKGDSIQKDKRLMLGTPTGTRMLSGLEFTVCAYLNLPM